MTITGAGRKATVNAKEPESIADYLRVLPSVKFTPDDLLLIKGEGGPRRRALDRSVFGLTPSHLKHLLDYNRALKQKNALLRTGRADGAQLEVWNHALAEQGARVIAFRLDFIRRVEPLLAEFFAEISASKEEAGLRYRGLDEAPADLPARLFQALQEKREEEIERGHTLVGPHRDDLVMEIGGRSVRKYASQGQHRMFALALKVAEIELHRRILGRYPLLLLDDVKSELDHDRVRYLFGFLNRIPAQIFVTATDLAELSGEVTRPYRVWTVRQGVATARE